MTLIDRVERPKLKEKRVLPEAQGPFGHVRREVSERIGRVTLVIHADAETSLRFLPSGKEALEMEKELIRNPQTNHVYVQSYTYDDDPMGWDFLHTFEEATKKNPHVSYGLLVDHIYAVRGRSAHVRDMLTRLNSNGHVHVAVTNYFNFLGIHKNPLHRNHQKIASDGERALILTANIGEHHAHWVDAGILFEGPVARVIDQIAAGTFAYAEKWRHVYQTTDIPEYIRKYGVIPKYQDVLGAIVRSPDDRGQRIIVRSPKGQTIEVLTDSFYKPYQEATNAAFDMIEHAAPGAILDIYTPYPGLFTLTDKMLRARANGVQINLHMPSKNDYALYNAEMLPSLLQPLVTKQLDGWRKKLADAGIHIFEFVGDEDGGSNGMSHIKAVRVRNPDGTGKLWFGSSNLNKGPFAGMNREIAVVLSDESVLAEFENFQEWFRKQSQQLF